MKELPNRRTKTMKVFEKASDERLYRCHVGNIHYPDSAKKWQDIDTTLLSKAGGFYVDKNVSKYEIPDKANGVFSFFNQDHFLDLSLVGAASSGYKSTGPNSVRYENVFGDGIHFDVSITHLGMVKRIVFEKPPLNPNQDFILDYEILSMPDVIEVGDFAHPGQFIAVNPNLSAITAVKLTNKIIQMYPSTGGLNKSFISKVCCMNSDPEPNSGRIQLVGLIFYRSGGRNYLRKVIPKEIFKDGFYPIWADDPATYEAGNGDGFCQNSSYAAWDTNHDAVSGDAWTGNYDLEAGCYYNGAIWTFMKTGIPIDTSGINDGDTITAVDLHLYGSSKTGSALEVCIVGESAAGLTDPLAGEDFNDIGDAVDNPTEFATRKNYAAWNSAGDNSFAYNANGIASINKTGTTWVGVRIGADCDDIEPNPKVTALVKFENSEANGNDAYLDVTVSAAGWSNKIQGILSPAKILGIDNTSIAKVIGV